MADKRLRDRERAAQQGDPQAEARLLNERVRAGQIAAADLELAAQLGHPAASSALPHIKRAGNPLREIDKLASGVVQRANHRLHMAVRRELIDYIRAEWQARGTVSDPALSVDDSDDDEHEELEIGDITIPLAVIQQMREFAGSARDERDSSRLRDVMRLYAIESITEDPLIRISVDLVMLCVNHRPLIEVVRGLSLFLQALMRGKSKECDRLAKQMILDAAYAELLASPS